jgi:hypothetical protein
MNNYTHKWGSPLKNKYQENGDPEKEEKKETKSGLGQYFGDIYDTYQKQGLESAVGKAIGWGVEESNKSFDAAWDFVDSLDTKERQKEWNAMSKDDQGKFKSLQKETGNWDQFKGTDGERYGKIGIFGDFSDNIEHAIHSYMVAEKYGGTAAKALGLGHEAGNVMASVTEGYPLPQVAGDSGTDMRNNLLGIEAYEKGLSMDDLLKQMKDTGVFKEKHEGAYNERTKETLKEDWFGKHEKQRLVENIGVGTIPNSLT